MQTELLLLLLLSLSGCQLGHGDLVTLRDDDYDEYTELPGEQQSPRRQNEIVAPCARDTTDGRIVCDCGDQESMTLAALPAFGEHFHISNCPRLHIPPGIFTLSRFVRSIHLRNVRHLHLSPGALRFSPQSRPISLNFASVHFATVASHSIHGNIELLHFDDCHLVDVHAFAIRPTRDMLSLMVRNSRVEQMARHVLKKFSVAQMGLLNSSWVQPVPSQAVREVEVTERLSIQDSRFGEVLPNAFQFETVRIFQMLNNRIGTLNGSSLHMTIADRCTIAGNNITETDSTAFAAITSTFSRRPQFALQFQPPEFQFTDNRLGNAAPLDFRLQLAANAFIVQITQLHLLTPVRCDHLDQHQTSEFQRQNANALLLRTCERCEPTGYLQLRDHQCRVDRTLAFVAAGVAAMVVLLVLTVLAVWWLYRRRRAALARMQVVQPEARTYRETQIVIQIENAGLLKTDL